MPKGPADGFEAQGCLRTDRTVLREALGLAFRSDIRSLVLRLNDRAGRTAQALAEEGGQDLWIEIFRLLESMGLETWVWKRLRSECGGPATGVLPASVAAHLDKRSQQATVGNMILLDALDEFVRLAEKRRIPIMPIKGAALLSEPFRLYADLGSRKMSDLDLFCPPARIEEASALARRLGYGVTQSFLDARGLGHHRYFSRKAKKGQGGAGRKSDPVVTLELHYRLTVWWWRMGALDQIVTREILQAGVDRWGRGGHHQGPKAWVELHLILLCLHFLKHGMGPDLRNVVDIVELARQRSVDWLAFEDLARRAGVWKTVNFVLAWIQDAILAPAGGVGPWVGAGLVDPNSSTPLLGKLIPRNRVPPMPDWPVPSLRGSAVPRILDRRTSKIFCYAALLPGPTAKAASALWWWWDRWDLRRLLGRGGH